VPLGLPRSVQRGLLVASAQFAEITLAEPAMATIRVPQPRGRPRCRPRELVADKGYDSDDFRQALRRRGIHPCIPLRSNRRPRGGRPALRSYSSRWIIERSNAWLKSFRRVQTRYERLVQIYLGFVLLAFIVICLRHLLK